ncbi:ABC transporter permease [Neokomagataea anthophila]|uniref:ABC transporter permease n=1 Tax=Neokomagataea anthophila TaxID=2826925 RepID=A0ABS5E5W6_9PROT|nr:ABC transporter permease [Neokomagataea anthophila]MBR0559285.1 ABC transporter permease [Neokomagataea anthophila]
MFSRTSLRYIWLIALRDFQQTLRTKSFWLTVVFVPLFPLLMGSVMPHLIHDTAPEQTIILDKSGTVASTLEHAIRKDDPTVQITPPPAALTAAEPDHLASLLKPYISPEKSVQHPFKGYIVAIPAAFPQDPHVQIWVSHSPGSILTIIKATLAHDMRIKGMTDAGLSPEIAVQINGATPSIGLHLPEHGLSADMLRNIGPTALALMLLISTIFTTQWLLQALVEERSGKLLEALLSSVSVDHIMLGKLLAALMSLCLLFGTWITAGISLLTHFGPQFGVEPAPILASLLTPRVLIGAPFFFLTGATLMAMIAFAVGVRCDTTREAQGMLAPVLMALILPVEILLQLTVAGVATQSISQLRWIPLWTPFLNLSQLNSAPLWELIVQGGEMLVVCAILVPLINRLFRHSILDYSAASGWKGMKTALLHAIKNRDA